MSDNSNQPDPPRRRAGLLSALTRIYSEAHRLMKNGGSPEEVAEIRTKIEDRYTAYLESHELTLAEYPDRETSLVKSHDHNELKYQLILDNLDAYIAEGSEPEDIGSLHAASLFSVRSTATRKSKPSSHAVSSERASSAASQSSRSNNDRLSESRVQAELAKRRFEQQQAEQLTDQRRIDFEREVAKQKRELDKHREDVAQRQKELDQRERQLQEEAEFHKRELEIIQKTQKQQEEMENLQAEVKLREQEQIRAEFGSNCETESECLGSTEGNEQFASKHVTQLKDQLGYSSRRYVTNWLSDCETDAARPENPSQRKKTSNLRQRTTCASLAVCGDQRGYIPPAKTVDNLRASGVYPEKPCSKPPETSDAALFRRALLENRMPAPKQLEFDGNPRTFLAFLASFKTNIEQKLSDDDEDAALKLTYLIQHCVGDAKYLIDDCAMLEPRQGFETAMERLRDRYGQGHVIARSYIESVTKGPPIKQYDVKALVKLKDDMVKCQSVLSLLQFSSDLDCTGTLISVCERLPECFHLKWARKAAKILKSGRNTRFSDLVDFVRSETNVYSSKFGLFYAERHFSQKD